MSREKSEFESFEVYKCVRELVKATFAMTEKWSQERWYFLVAWLSVGALISCLQKLP